MSDERMLPILREIAENIKNGEAMAEHDRQQRAAIEIEMIKLNDSQVFLQSAIEKAMLAFQRTEDLANRTAKESQSNTMALTDIRYQMAANDKTFLETIAEINRIRMEWESREERWNYRLNIVESDTLPHLYKEIERRVTHEEFKDHQQERAIAQGKEKIKEYEGIKDQVKAFIKKFGLLIGMVAWPIIGAIKGAVNWGEIWEWLVDNIL